MFRCTCLPCNQCVLLVALCVIVGGSQESGRRRIIVRWSTQTIGQVHEYAPVRKQLNIDRHHGLCIMIPHVLTGGTHAPLISFHAHPHDAAVPVPYTSRLGQPLQAGQTLNIHGRINDEAARVEVNLLNGSTEISPHVGQAVCHLNLRFDENKIVINSFTGGVWGKEERESLPFKKGEDFDLRIRILDDYLEISCDGKKVHEFKHRVPYSQIEYLQIKGDCTLTGVHWGGRFYQLPWETGFPTGALKAGQRIYLYGVPKGDRWNFDLLGSAGDILFHFNPRFKEKQIVRNAYKKGFWEKEEREGPFPFEKEKGFDLAILNEPYSIQIFVNNQRIGTFQHRTENPGNDYIGMRIEGDIEITGIEFSH